MFVRQGSFRVIPGKLDELREIYYRDCVPLVEDAPGNLDVFLLEPIEGEGPIIACTIWKTERDAIAYETGGAAMAIAARVRGYVAGPPTLKSYRVQR